MNLLNGASGKIHPSRPYATDVCHGNFGPAKILVRGTKIPKIGPPDRIFAKYFGPHVE